MMLPSSYFDSEVPIGTSKRYVHEDCPKETKTSAPGKALVVTRTQEGYSWFCHRCKQYGKRGLDGLSPAETIRWIKSIKLKPKMYRKEVKLPEDFTSEMPASALAYLWARGVTDADMHKFNLGYSPNFNRLIFPIFDGTELVFWQGRNLGEITRENPKYVNQAQLGRKDVFFKVLTDNKVLTITEDIVSAIRVSAVTDAIAMLSAHIPDKIIFDLAFAEVSWNIRKLNYEKILIWLDPDKYRKAFDWMSRYRSFGIDCMLVNTPKDPKWFDAAFMKALIEAKLNGRLI